MFGHSKIISAASWLATAYQVSWFVYAFLSVLSLLDRSWRSSRLRNLFRGMVLPAPWVSSSRLLTGAHWVYTQVLVVTAPLAVLIRRCWRGSWIAREWTGVQTLTRHPSFFLQRLAAAVKQVRLDHGLGFLLFAFPFLPTPVLVALVWGLIGAGLLSASLTRHDRGWSTGGPAAWMAPLTVFFAALTVAALFSSTPTSSLVQYVFWLTAFAGFVWVAFSRRPLRAFEGIAWGAAVGAALASLLGIAQFAAGVEVTEAWLDPNIETLTTRVFGPFDNPIMLGEYLVLTIPLTVWLWARQGAQLFQRLAAVALTAIQGAAVLLTFSRGAWLSLIVAAGYVLLRRQRRLLPLLLVGLVLVLVSLPETFAERALSAFSLEQSTNRYRLTILEGSWPLLVNHPVIGVGLGIPAFLEAYTATMIAGTTAFHSHNLFLQIGIEAGVFALLGLVWFLIAMFAQSSGTRLTELGADARGNQRLMIAVLSAGLTGQLFFHGMVDYLWYSPRLLIFFWLWFGLLAATVRRAAP